jgi:membrane protease YdiL (CAAX protease family)
MAYQTLLYAYIVQVAIGLIPIVHSKATHRDLRDYGLQIIGRLLVPGLSLSMGIGICLSFISSPISPTISQILLICLVAPVCEEFFFRGFLQTHLMGRVKGEKKLFRFHFSYGLILTALIFGAVHVYDIFLFDLSAINAVINAMLAMIFGLMLGYVYQETHSILGPILMHVCLNGLPIALPF